MKKNSIGVSKPFFTMFLYCLIIKIQYEKIDIFIITYSCDVLCALPRIPAHCAVVIYCST